MNRTKDMDTDRLETFIVFTMLFGLIFQFFGFFGGPQPRVPDADGSIQLQCVFNLFRYSFLNGCLFSSMKICHVLKRVLGLTYRFVVSLI